MPRSAPRRPGRPRQPVPKELILQRAAEAFAAEGYSGTSLETISESVGMRRPSLLHRVGSKAALYNAVLDLVLGDLGKLIQEALESEGDYPTRLGNLIGGVADYLGHTPHAARIIYREVVNRGPYASGDGKELINSVVAAGASFLEMGMKAGIWTHRDARQQMMSIVGLLLTWFATPTVSSNLIGADVFSPVEVAKRREEVCAQVNRLLA